ncbi:aminodeoxychorismate/anthranilate synthase component II [Nocardioides sp. BP30]|uniref:anthranilate synthase component II n=1 Tax=Nocardioides sp. BP30 TaxID=3036374 RepID=UPI0024688C37|nr:aminodeoxychorismate/anthranilate synthase component II [Nocardioides sp. BP30]WGL52730.1 aminodeoxychorismate/anthranilate synthase component II [Nocardioides sp. BP30]
MVVIDHHDSYTWNLAHLVAAVTGALPDVVAHDAVVPADLDGFSHVVLSPGPGHPDEYDWSVLDLGLPVLGVCLGMQGLVTHLGGTVERARPAHGEVARIGHDGRGVFSGLPQGLRAVRYHSLVAGEVTGSLEVSARAEDGTVMGVRHRRLPLEGVQFHPESILSEYGEAIVATFLTGVR